VVEPRTFLEWASVFVGTFAISLVMLRLGDPKLEQLDAPTDSSLRALFRSTVSMLPPRAPLRRALQAVPRSLWAGG